MILLSEVSQTEKDKDITYMTQMNLSIKQKQSQRHREQVCGCEGGEGWGSID